MTDGEPRRDWKPVARVSAPILLGCVVLGALMGLAWALLAPRTQLTIKDGEAVYVRMSEGAVGADLTFGGLAVVCGLLVGFAVALRWKSGGIELLVAAAFGGFLGSLLAWKLGLAIVGGDSDAGTPTTEGRTEGVTFEGPLAINSPGVLVLWSLVAVAVLTVFLWRRGVAASRRIDALALEGQKINAPVA